MERIRRAGALLAAGAASGSGLPPRRARRAPPVAQEEAGHGRGAEAPKRARPLIAIAHQRRHRMTDYLMPAGILAAPTSPT